MKCTRCGTDNPKGKNVCRKCGAFLYASNPNNRVPLTLQQRKERRIMWLKGTALGCFWSALVIIGMFLVLGLFSWLLVRFVIPEDFFIDDPAVTSADTQTPGSDTGATTRKTD